MIEEALAAIGAGRLAIVPTDTVYGVATTPHAAAAAERLYRAKRREPSQPVALVAADVELLLECIPELRGRGETVARALLPGPWTIVLGNPARRYSWLTGSRPDTIGVRVPDVSGVARELLTRAGAVAATSANLSGGRDPARVEDVPEELRAACAAVVDAGELPGTASTVIDFSAGEPRVVREGAAASVDAIARAREALA